MASTNGVVSLLIFDRSIYGSSGSAATLAFESEAEARAWATKYMGAFRQVSVFIVFGKAELLEAPKASGKEVL